MQQSNLRFYSTLYSYIIKEKQEYKNILLYYFILYYYIILYYIIILFKKCLNLEEFLLN